MRRGLVIAAAAVMVVGLLGCGGSAETPFEEANHEAQAAHRRLTTAEKNFEEDSRRYNETLNENPHPAATCRHLRAHQLHSPNRILAQEAREYVEEECR
jgi:hypothetical protein